MQMNLRSWSFLAVLILYAANVAIPSVSAGGSCTTPADCEDSNDCTVDVCMSNICQHNPVIPGTPCGNPSDTTCTDPDTCNAVGDCVRHDAPNGAACTVSNPCITGEACDFGVCAGTWTTGCCANDDDCDDHNACTSEVCMANACQSTNAAPGTPCGSGVDDDCTDPDACDTNGNCLTMDAVNGDDCGGPDCLGGQCGATTYAATMLPEAGFIGSEPREGVVNAGDRGFLVGRVIDAAEVDHAAVWIIQTGGGMNTITLLPENGAISSVANGVACGVQIDLPCLAVGSTELPGQPAAWISLNGGPWTMETVPLPAGFTGGSIEFVTDIASDLLARPGSDSVALPSRQWSTASDTAGSKNSADTKMAQGPSNAFAAVGYAVNPGGFRKATYWVRDSQGAWSVFLLGDFGPGRESAATDLAQCDTSWPAGLCDSGELLIAGWAEDGPGFARPVIWQETVASGEQFTMTTLPLPNGAVEMCFFPYCGGNFRALSFGGFSETVDAIYTSGTVKLADATTRGVVWKTTDFSSWTSAILPPLPGQANSAQTAPIRKRTLGDIICDAPARPILQTATRSSTAWPHSGR